MIANSRPDAQRDRTRADAEPEFREPRFKASVETLEWMHQAMLPIPGRKQLLWASFGIQGSIHFGEGRQEFTSRLCQLAASFSGDNIAIYTVDPVMRVRSLSATPATGRDGRSTIAPNPPGKT